MTTNTTAPNPLDEALALEWLQILVAPKLYLLEYARVLLR